MRKLNVYQIIKNGQIYETSLYDTVLGYGLTREIVNENKQKYPNDIWTCKKMSTT